MEGQYKQTVAPTLVPSMNVLTLTDAKTHCSITGTTDYDDYILDLIGRATEMIERHTSRQIMPATWTLTLDGFPAEIKIHKPPVTSVSSITYVDSNGDTQTLSSSLYQTNFATKDGPARIKPSYGNSWPSTRSGEYGSVVVTFVAGYASADNVPLTTRHAVAFLVAHWFKNREAVIVGTIASKLPLGIEMLLAMEDWGSYA